MFDVLDPALLPVVSLADAKRHLNISATTDDEEVRKVLAIATDLAERYTGRALRRKTVVETHDGGTATALLLRQPPALSVSSVVESGTTLASTGYTLNAPAGLLYRGSTTSTTTAIAC